MMRRCDGTDPYLVVYVSPISGEKQTHYKHGVEAKPCDCGLVFDDTRRFVIWPHQEF